ncbi:MAG: holin [Pseudomonadota bacterium]
MNETQQQAVETTVDATLAAAGSKATWAGAGTAVAAFFTSSEFGVLIGMLIGITGLLIQWYYRRKQDRREEAADRRAQAEHERRMAEK